MRTGEGACATRNRGIIAFAEVNSPVRGARAVAQSDLWEPWVTRCVIIPEPRRGGSLAARLTHHDAGKPATTIDEGTASLKALITIALLLLIAGAFGCVPFRDTLPPGKASIRLLGRWDARGAPDRFVTVNPGSSFEFWYEGTTCVLRFDRSANKPPLPQLWVRFDGAWTKHVVDRDALTLGQPGGEPARHHVWVVLRSADEHQPRWKPPLAASLTLTGVGVPNGLFVRPPRRRRIFEAIGDSITEGVLAVRKGTLEEWTEIADSRATYAFQTALALDAEPRIIGFGAQGTTKGGNGGVPPVGLAYPFVYEGVAADERPADIVAINHGCNDGRARSIESLYTNLVRLARRRNPKAAIFCVVPFAQVHAASIRGAVDTMRANGDAWVFLVETKGWLDPKADTTDGVHPNEQGHAKAAKELAAVIRRALGR